MTGRRTRARGELEGEVMRILWEHTEPLSARAILKMFTGRMPAYTTLLTVLDRLQKKGHVVRSGDSPRKLRFQASWSQEEHTSETMLTALQQAGDRRGALLNFAGNLQAEDLELLRGMLPRAASDSGKGR